jgi:hypothetical protein
VVSFKKPAPSPTKAKASEVNSDALHKKDKTNETTINQINQTGNLAFQTDRVAGLPTSRYAGLDARPETIDHCPIYGPTLPGQTPDCTGRVHEWPSVGHRKFGDRNKKLNN